METSLADVNFKDIVSLVNLITDPISQTLVIPEEELAQVEDFIKSHFAPPRARANQQQAHPIPQANFMADDGSARNVIIPAATVNGEQRSGRRRIAITYFS